MSASSSSPAQVSRFDRILSSPDDPEAVRLQKRVLLASALMMSGGGVVWGTALGLASEMSVAVVPYGYTALTLLNIGVYQIWRGYLFFRTLQLLLTLILPFLLHLVLGGFAESSAVIAWALLAPMGALLFTTRREAQLWFAAFVAELTVAAVLEQRGAPAAGLDFAVRATFYGLNLGVPTLAAFLILEHFVEQKDATMSLLEDEQQQTERLLLNVLPREVAAQLRIKELANEEATIAESFDSISVLFADIVGFTALSRQLSPAQMVNTLNAIFSHFDTLVERHGVEKIRTIGDNYMVAAGVPSPRDDHAGALVSMALDMKEYLEARSKAADVQLSFRIGINSGPAVGGIVGKTKFHYDVWGDAVNIASRMESHGEAGRIQIGQATRDLLGDTFICEPRGEIDLKGRGKMQAWFVEGRVG